MGEFKVAVLCHGLLGIQQGLADCGCVMTDNLSEAHLVLTCNSRIHAPRLAMQLIGLKMVSAWSTRIALARENEQLGCRRALAQMDGCDFNHLGIQPPQYRLPEECDQLARQTGPVLTKPSGGWHGRNIAYHETPPSLQSCLDLYKDHIGLVYIAVQV